MLELIGKLTTFTTAAAHYMLHAGVMVWVLSLVSIIPLTLLFWFLWPPVKWALRNMFSLVLLEPARFTLRWLRLSIVWLRAWDKRWNG